MARKLSPTSAGWTIVRPPGGEWPYSRTASEPMDST
jgi:hypothetical protein